MKYIALFLLAIGSTAAWGDVTADLEERVAALETQMDTMKRDALSDCRLDLRYYTVRTNNCPFDSVVKEVFPIRGSDSIRVTCYKYELTCMRAGVPETIPVSVEN